MATLNVGAMAARLGLDTSEFLDKMKGVQGANAFMSGEMARQWKQTSREGAESFRLIDEALGIHLSRPLTRILTQEFPAFASVLQSVLGAGVVGALGVAGFEAFEKISKGIENARKARKDWADASLSADETVGSVLGGLRQKLSALEGQPAALKFRIEGAEEAKRAIDEIGKVLEKEEAAAEKANSITTRFESAMGDFFSHEAEGWTRIADLLGGDAMGEIVGAGGLHDKLFDSQDLKNMKSALADMKTDLAIALNDDKDKGTHNALSLITRDVKAATEYLTDMRNAGDAAGIALAASAERYFEDAAKIEGLTGKIAGAKTAGADNAEQIAAGEKLAALYKEMGSSIAKLQPETDPIKKLETEIAGFRIAAEADFRELGRSAASALTMSTATGELDRYEKKLDGLKIKLEADIRAQQALDELGKIHLGAPKGAATPIDITTPAVMPTLGAGGTGAAQLDTFAKDQAAQLKMAAQAYQDAMGPQQKYELVEQELDLLLKEKLIDQNAYNAALAQAVDLKSKSAKKGLEGSVDALNPGGGQMQQLRQQMDALRAMASSGVGLDGSKLNAGDLAAIKLQMQAITEEEDKILLKTGGVDAGFKAWADDLQRVKSEGEFTFEMLTQASKGFEDNAVKSIMQILETQRGGHANLIKQLRSMWSNYFDNLAEMAMKQGLQKLLAPVGTMITQKIPALGGVLGSAGKDTALATNTTALGLNTTADTADTTALGLNTTALGVLTAKMGASAGVGIGIPGIGTGGGSDAGGGGSIGDGIDSAMPGNAAGTDFWPGGSTWVGERGPEILNLPRGSQVTPNDVATRGGGTTNHYHYDQRGAVVTDDLMRKGDAARMIAAGKNTAVQEAIMNVSEIAKRSLRR